MSSTLASVYGRVPTERHKQHNRPHGAGNLQVAKQAAEHGLEQVEGPAATQKRAERLMSRPCEWQQIMWNTWRGGAAARQTNRATWLGRWTHRQLAQASIHAGRNARRSSEAASLSRQCDGRNSLDGLQLLETRAGRERPRVWWITH